MVQRRILLAFALLCLLAGCFDVNDEVWWNADGSAKLRRTIRLALASPDAAKAKADAINEAAEFSRIEIRRDTRVKSFDVRTSVEGNDVVAVAEIEVTDGKDLTSVVQAIAKKVKVDNATFEWIPNFTFEKTANGNHRFVASIAEVRPPASFDKEQAKATFGERAWTLRYYGSPIVAAVPASAQIGSGRVEWKTALADIASGQVKDAELLAEVGPPFPATAMAIVGGLAIVLVFALVLTLQLRKKAALEAEKPVRPPAPRTMPTVTESGPIPMLPSAEALLSDASEINVDTEDEAAAAATPAPAIVNAQKTADAVVKFKCPGCQSELKVPLHLAGRQGKCRKCGSAFVSPVPGQLKQVREKVAAAPITESASLRDQFSVKKVKCSCGMTSAVLKGRGDGSERCPACNQVLVLT